MGHAPRGGQSPDEVTEVGPDGAGRTDLSGQFNGKTPASGANCFESHTRIDTTDTHPDQPVPDQPDPDSQMASVGPFEVPGRSK